VLFAFLIYTSIPIISTYRAKSKFRKSDIVLLAINTVFSSLIMYAVFYSFKLDDYTGSLAVIFALVYLLLGRLVETKFTAQERHARELFYLTGLAFVILIIPMQFGREWLSIGWLAEGVLLAIYGIMTNEKRFKQVGLFIYALCLAAFFMIDVPQYDHSLFVLQYSSITAGSLAILGTYMYKKTMTGIFVTIYKYFVLANTWLFTMYLILIKLREAVYSVYLYRALSDYHIDYLIWAAAVVFTFFFAYTYCRIKLLSDKGTKFLSMILYVLGILMLTLINATRSPVLYIYFTPATPSIGISIIGTAILMLLGLLSVFALRDLMMLVVMDRKLGIEWYPLVLSGYFVIILTQNLISQFNLAFSSIAISIIYVLTALAWIIIGFRGRYLFIRMFGLGLAIMSVIKLFLIDLRGLTQGYQIISYFSLGVTLLAISFVYQYFNKRLEAIPVGMPIGIPEEDQS